MVIALSCYTDLEQKISPQILFLCYSVLLSHLDLTLLTFVIRFVTLVPGGTHVFHFVRTKNLPFSVEEVRQMTKACRVCAEHKPQFHKPVRAYLIKATQSFERLNVDFKGPLKLNNQNSYFFNVIDEYSRFPSVFPSMDISNPTVIRCLSQFFAIFGMPVYVHSDRSSSFMSDELLRFFLNKGIATS